jgi:hypothetical protein
MNETEPLMKCRENEHPVKTTVSMSRRIIVAVTCLPATWKASLRRHDFYSGLIMELGKSCRYEETQGKGTSRENTCEAEYRCSARWRTIS